MADRVKCLYCGEKIPADSAHCPKCGAVSHFQERGYRAGVRGKFIFWFVVLVIVCAIMILWLPR
ncbi:zinc-ribbon domain-containing protein [Thiolapillus sp.]|uniref:Protein nirD n=1 Tax=Thiolapillus brandeum TaxID=1076588 RepID=A0A831RS72_9GAMM|nr:zinc-ribbon domain-containing protein [Thiolapillus sp.]HEC06101.1 protein nirD [Thiolapillus brandeum]